MGVARASSRLRSPFLCVCSNHVLVCVSLLACLQEYVLYGATLDARTRDENDMTMDSALFMKMAKEAGLVGRACTPADVDVIFSKVKTPGLRKIGFEEFEMALALIGA